MSGNEIIPLAVGAAETAVSATTAHAVAAVQARYAVARSRPRDMDTVRLRLLAECKRPGFADASIYEIPRGGKTISGFSIRFAEAAMRLCGNLLAESATIYDDAEKRIIRVTVTDLETNTSYPTDRVIPKTVERRRTRDGQEVLSQRTTSTGETVYIVRATDDEVAMAEAGIVSRVIRTSGLRLIPGDILDECAQQIHSTIAAGAAAEDPAARKKRILDAFAVVGVSPSALKKHLGKELEALRADELVSLRALLASLKDGEVTWAEVTSEAEPPKDDQDERLALVQRLARLRVSDPLAFGAGASAVGVAADVRMESLSVAVLKKLDAASQPNGGQAVAQ